ncbi:hypothetical protein HX116_09885 [Acinetobacter towneri]|uniref:hypothetical protein n=1 Tax=Acinetobacter towneri TaxID=202956 RepID=UPI002578C109|nr:hypothetical protein [Acinetobacter towneri]MDM1731460.1 hypothetical protein [Acinetobacter towneri]MDM1734123.1 hypothetical protein [Acinetobacter towneri]MDM1739354.1 hypothetical protein [Acinetobacter towneri]MDM1742146.1 hypothetical protein [Acinetobacter towneri]MDM1744723.1 hypothetical protein [Acinetobacter towneri]
MDFQKEKHEYLTMLVDHGAITQEQSDSLGLFNSNIGLHSNSITSSLMDCINWGWQSWLKAKAIPDGFVLMPIKPTETMVAAVAKEHEGDAFLPYSLYDAYVKQAMIEAQEPANESE